VICAALVIAAAALGCGKSRAHDARAAAVPGAQVIGAMKMLADQACACGTDTACLHGVRDRYDAQKPQLVANPSFTAAERTTLSAEGSRMAACGDAGGLTFW
jgi:hypothetical protein